MQPYVIGPGLLLSLLLSGAGQLWAQCNTAGSFTGSLRTTATAGCVPLRIETGSTLTGVQNIRYVYEYDGQRETPVTTRSSYTYTKPGQYTLLQLSEKDGLTLRACASVTVYDTLPPRVDLTACGTVASLAVTDPLASPFQYDYFLIDWGDNQTDTLRSASSTVGHGYATSDPHRIRVQGIHGFSTCGGITNLIFRPNQPASIRSVEPVGPQTVQLQIQNPAGVDLLVQQRSGNGTYQAGPVVPPGVSATVTMPADTGLTCYRVVPVRPCPGQNPSPEICYQSVRQGGEGYAFPAAFSPNDDGLNDVFGPVGAEPAATYYLLTIVDRWGRVVFAASAPEQTWDGRIGGRAAPAGVYAYWLDARLSGGQRHQQRGQLHLIR